MKINKLKQILSYILPIPIEVCSSEFNSVLEVTLNRGRYVLDAQNSNYSFGALYTIFKNTFIDLGITEKPIKNCLLLGLGGGSVVNLLQKKHNLSIPITAVEIDPVVIDLGKKYFNLNNYKDLSIINEDAFDFAMYCNKRFDMIIVDLYINDVVPDKFHSSEFISYLEKMSHSSTVVLFNKMLNSTSAKSGYSRVVKEMIAKFGSVRLLTYNVNSVTNKIICVNTSGAKVKKMTEINSTYEMPILLLNPKLN